jgi:hypothetical protein
MTVLRATERLPQPHAVDAVVSPIILNALWFCGLVIPRAAINACVGGRRGVH